MVHQFAGSRHVFLVGVLALLLGLPRASAAQSVQPGDRIRVIRRDGLSPAVIGSLVRFTSDSVWFRLREHNQPISVALGPTVRLDRSLGRGSRVGAGALIGAGVGAAITALFLSGFCGGDTLCNGDEQLRAAAIFGLPSLALGAGIGALIKVERWAPLSLGAGAAARIQLGVRVGWQGPF